jgi:serine-type D-Ala-D-Ala carboxypeptidase (penicillin-binding protein 5/6)
MHPTNSRAPRGLDGVRTGHRRHRTSRTLLTALACLTALGCLASLVIAKRHMSPVRPTALSRPTAWPAGTPSPAAAPATASQPRLGAAYVILQHHPLPASGSGPDITVGPSEAAEYPSQVAAGDSLVAVAAGETLTERQALEALLLPSADNMAWILARWDAGSQAAFAARMNAAARSLAMSATSYTDPAGLDPSTISTAADQVRLGMAAMQVPALAAITAESTAVVPVAGVVRNTNALLGQDGIVGLKTGSTAAAGGCLLVAAWQEVNGHNILIVAATFGQPGTAGTILPNAEQAGRNLVLELDAALGTGPQPGSRDNSEDPPQRPARARND